MKSPFPGMDPYIEGCDLWRDFHDDLISEFKRAIAAALPERYVVRTEERSYVVLLGAEGKEQHVFFPDVRVFAAPPPEGRETRAARGAALAAPTEAVSPIPMRPFIEEEFRENFIEVFDADNDNRLVTCVEVLSPSNKASGTAGRDIYLRKRQGLLLGEANLVEIDLLRGGERMPMLDRWPTSPYTILVSRPRTIRRCLVWPASFREPLPVVPVPLLKPDPDVPLDLQPMVEAIYARSRYEISIDYSQPLSPALTPEQAAWLEARLSARAEAPQPPASPRRARRRK